MIKKTYITVQFILLVAFCYYGIYNGVKGFFNYVNKNKLPDVIEILTVKELQGFELVNYEEKQKLLPAEPCSSHKASILSKVESVEKFAFVYHGLGAKLISGVYYNEVNFERYFCSTSLDKDFFNSISVYIPASIDSNTWGKLTLSNDFLLNKENGELTLKYTFKRKPELDFFIIVIYLLALAIYAGIIGTISLAIKKHITVFNEKPTTT